MSTLKRGMYLNDVLGLTCREQSSLIKFNLGHRVGQLRASLTEYTIAGAGLERLVDEYLRTHVAIVRCDDECQELRKLAVFRKL
jgi:hypothetical protein